MTGLERSDKEIKDLKEVESILREVRVGRLGTCCDGQPYVVPLSFSYDDGKILFHGAKKGKKMDNILKNPKVCFEVDEGELISADNPCDFNFKYRSVIANGTARIINDSKQKVDALRKLVEKYAPGKVEYLSEENTDMFEDLAVVEIEIDKMVGKKSAG